MIPFSGERPRYLGLNGSDCQPVEVKSNSDMAQKMPWISRHRTGIYINDGLASINMIKRFARAKLHLLEGKILTDADKEAYDRLREGLTLSNWP